MKKLLALLLAALVLLSLPILPARADEDEPEAPAAADSPAEPAADPTEPPAPAETPDPTEPPAPAETPAPTEPAAEAPDPTEAPAPADEPDPTEAPAPADEPDPTEAPAATEEPGSDEQPEDPAETPRTKTEEQSADRPQREKSLARWEKERADIALTGDLREDILIIARSQLGYSADKTYFELDESGKKRNYTRYGEWHGLKFGDWCNMFVSFCIYYAGNESYPVESSCMRYMYYLKRAGYWREWNSYIPQKGDVVFFNFDPENSLTPTHVGLVEEVVPAEGDKPGRLVTIEGNLPNLDGPTACVRRMERPLTSVVGYGTYEQGKVYPESFTVRSDGWRIIGPDSAYFVEYPQEEVLRFLGMTKSRYYAYWFPEGEPVQEEPQPAAPAVVPKPQRPEKGKRSPDDLGDLK